VKHLAGGGGASLLAAAFYAYASGALPARGAEAGTATTPSAPASQVAHGKVLFISYGCGWCHEDGGRKAGKCPQLMADQHDDNFLLSRIAVGSPGKMPAFGEALTEDDFNALLAYIRSLAPETNP
jgi:mono/diheme cytochrome c family protein